MMLGLQYADTETEQVVTVKLSKRQAEWVSNGMSDLLCWARGFNAALHDDETERAPIGITEIREFRLHLLGQIEDAE